MTKCPFSAYKNEPECLHSGMVCAGGVYRTDTMYALHQMRCYFGQQQEHGAHWLATCCNTTGLPCIATNLFSSAEFQIQKSCM